MEIIRFCSGLEYLKIIVDQERGREIPIPKSTLGLKVITAKDVKFTQYEVYEVTLAVLF